MSICFYFLGNLSNFLGEKMCFSKDSCRPIRDIVTELIRKYSVPVEPGFLIYISENGLTIRGEEDICKFSSIYVLKAVQGGRLSS